LFGETLAAKDAEKEAAGTTSLPSELQRMDSVPSDMSRLHRTCVLLIIEIPTPCPVESLNIVSLTLMFNDNMDFALRYIEGNL
jgi:hypothetical protein